MLSGGHYMEMVKIIKQVRQFDRKGSSLAQLKFTISSWWSQAQGISYPTIVRDLWKHEGVLGFYKGFLPW